MVRDIGEDSSHRQARNGGYRHGLLIHDGIGDSRWSLARARDAATRKGHEDRAWESSGGLDRAFSPFFECAHVPWGLRPRLVWFGPAALRMLDPSRGRSLYMRPASLKTRYVSRLNDRRGSYCSAIIGHSLFVCKAAASHWAVSSPGRRAKARPRYAAASGSLRCR